MSGNPIPEGMRPLGFKDHLKLFREARGWTQADMAKHSGFLPAAISHFETGERSPSLHNLLKLCNALGVTLDDLVVTGPTRSALTAWCEKHGFYPHEHPGQHYDIPLPVEPTPMAWAVIFPGSTPLATVNKSQAYSFEGKAEIVPLFPRTEIPCQKEGDRTTCPICECKLLPDKRCPDCSPKLTVKESFTVEHAAEDSQQAVCSECDGNGGDTFGDEFCPKCKGSGWEKNSNQRDKDSQQGAVSERHREFLRELNLFGVNRIDIAGSLPIVAKHFPDQSAEKCKSCDGSSYERAAGGHGDIIEGDCSMCGGSGLQEDAEIITSKAEINRLTRELHEANEKLRPGSKTERAPTAWAYEQACRVNHEKTAEVERLNKVGADYLLKNESLFQENERLRAELDPPVCRLQLPDGTVPGNAREAAEGWHKEANRFWTERDKLRARVAVLEAENTKLFGQLQDAKEALEPFAKVADFYEGTIHKEDYVVDGYAPHGKPPFKLHLGDYRKAREALKPIKEAKS